MTIHKTLTTKDYFRHDLTRTYIFSIIIMSVDRATTALKKYLTFILEIVTVTGVAIVCSVAPVYFVAAIKWLSIQMMAMHCGPSIPEPESEWWIYRMGEQAYGVHSGITQTAATSGDRGPCSKLLTIIATCDYVIACQYETIIMSLCGFIVAQRLVAQTPGAANNNNTPGVAATGGGGMGATTGGDTASM